MQPRDQLLTHASGGSNTARAFVASEQEIVAYNQANQSTPLTAVAPSSGSPQLTYQVLYPKQAKPVATRAKQLLEKTLTS